LDDGWSLQTRDFQWFEHEKGITSEKVNYVLLRQDFAGLHSPFNDMTPLGGENRRQGGLAERADGE
jgi:hypothetical protein